MHIYLVVIGLGGLGLLVAFFLVGAKKVDFSPKSRKEKVTFEVEFSDNFDFRF